MKKHYINPTICPMVFAAKDWMTVSKEEETKEPTNLNVRDTGEGDNWNW